MQHSLNPNMNYMYSSGQPGTTYKPTNSNLLSSTSPANIEIQGLDYEGSSSVMSGDFSGVTIAYVVVYLCFTVPFTVCYMVFGYTE